MGMIDYNASTFTRGVSSLYPTLCVFKGKISCRGRVTDETVQDVNKDFQRSETHLTHNEHLQSS
jgi:hypothetical protein